MLRLLSSALIRVNPAASFAFNSKERRRRRSNMFKTLFVIAAVVCAASAQADRYPAGLNPALCPNYPNCDNALIALYSQTGAPAPIPVARGYPAGVSPASCPNYPYCSTSSFYGHVEPLPGFAQRQYPAGVSASACPNYPYC